MGWKFAEQYSVKRSDRCFSVNDKRIFLVENYPKNTDKLPDNIFELQHRARDIMFSDKTFHNIQMAKAITFQLRFID